MPVYDYYPEFDFLLSLKDHAGEYISGDHIGSLREEILFVNGPNIPRAPHSSLPDDKNLGQP